MKPQELQIGDWCQSKNYEGNYLYNRVVALDSRSNQIVLENRWVDTDIIEPVPLTHEILEKNGWKDADENLVHNKYVFIHGESGVLTLNHWVDFYTFSFAGGDREVKYVLQLQHILRDCHLEELADNLKIE